MEGKNKDHCPHPPSSMPTDKREARGASGMWQNHWFHENATLCVSPPLPPVPDEQAAANATANDILYGRILRFPAVAPIPEIEAKYAGPIDPDSASC
mmetsp:Transcript_11915/g.20699  ORF Transcript_11915/g.20699 Transcript_11915/m.20699 type:complete len:97 (+) Transcript_11915:402-692(+)